MPYKKGQTMCLLMSFLAWYVFVDLRHTEHGIFCPMLQERANGPWISLKDWLMQHKPGPGPDTEPDSGPKAGGVTVVSWAYFSFYSC